MMAVTCVIATVLCGLVFAAILLFNHLSAGNNSLQVLFIIVICWRLFVWTNYSQYLTLNWIDLSDPIWNFFFLESECPLRIISRNDWTAQPPEENPIPLNLPVERVIIAHTNTTSCTTQVLWTHPNQSFWIELKVMDFFYLK